MHIHKWAVNPYATNIQSPATAAAKRASEIPRRARATAVVESYLGIAASTPTWSLNRLPLCVRGYAAQSVSL